MVASGAFILWVFNCPVWLSAVLFLLFISRFPHPQINISRLLFTVFQTEEAISKPFLFHLHFSWPDAIRISFTGRIALSRCEICSAGLNDTDWPHVIVSRLMPYSLIGMPTWLIKVIYSLLGVCGIPRKRTLWLRRSKPFSSDRFPNHGMLIPAHSLDSRHFIDTLKQLGYVFVKSCLKCGVFCTSLSQST